MVPTVVYLARFEMSTRRDCLSFLVLNTMPILCVAVIPKQGKEEKKADRSIVLRHIILPVLSSLSNLTQSHHPLTCKTLVVMGNGKGEDALCLRWDGLWSMDDDAIIARSIVLTMLSFPKDENIYLSNWSLRYACKYLCMLMEDDHDDGFQGHTSKQQLLLKVKKRSGGIIVVFSFSLLYTPWATTKDSQAISLG